MKIIKQTYIGQYRRHDGHMADVHQNTWDDRPIDYSVSWQDDTAFYHFENVAVCPPIDVWASQERNDHDNQNPAHTHPER